MADEESKTGQGTWIGGNYCKECDENFVALTDFDAHIEVLTHSPNRTIRHRLPHEYHEVGLVRSSRSWGECWEVIDDGKG